MISIEPPSDEFMKSGDVFLSPGGSHKYTVSGPVCVLYDREVNLPYPSCSLAWRGKQPSWNRIGCRLVVDMATKKCPAYAVILEGCEEPLMEHRTPGDNSPNYIHLPLYWKVLPSALRQWWYTPRSEKTAQFWNNPSKVLCHA